RARVGEAHEEAARAERRRVRPERPRPQREAPRGAPRDGRGERRQRGQRGEHRRPGGRAVSRPRAAFLAVWTLAITATASAFVVRLALRGKTVQLGYELGRARQEQARLREVKRVLEVESASYKTPERVEIVARTLLGMEPPPPERIVPLSQAPAGDEQDDDL